MSDTQNVSAYPRHRTSWPPWTRRSGASGAGLRNVAETFAEVPDGKTASHVLGVLAHLLDPA